MDNINNKEIAELLLHIYDLKQTGVVDSAFFKEKGLSRVTPVFASNRDALGLTHNISDKPKGKLYAKLFADLHKLLTSKRIRNLKRFGVALKSSVIVNEKSIGRARLFKLLGGLLGKKDSMFSLVNSVDQFFQVLDPNCGRLHDMGNKDDMGRNYLKSLITTVNLPMLKIANYLADRDFRTLTKLLNIHGDIEIIFKSSYPTDLVPHLYTRFLVRRLTQRFSLFESYRVLRPYLHDANLKGYLIRASGRFSKKQRASIYTFREGTIPISNFSARVIFHTENVTLKYGACTIKI
jgi:hypothetical protein